MGISPWLFVSKLGETVAHRQVLLLLAASVVKSLNRFLEKRPSESLNAQQDALVNSHFSEEAICFVLFHGRRKDPWHNLISLCTEDWLRSFWNFSWQVLGSEVRGPSAGLCRKRYKQGRVHQPL